VRRRCVRGKNALLHRPDNPIQNRSGILWEVFEPYAYSKPTVGVIGRFRRLSELHRCPEHTIEKIAQIHSALAKQHRTPNNQDQESTYRLRQCLAKNRAGRFWSAAVSSRLKEPAASERPADRDSDANDRVSGIWDHLRDRGDAEEDETGPTDPEGGCRRNRPSSNHFFARNGRNDFRSAPPLSVPCSEGTSDCIRSKHTERVLKFEISVLPCAPLLAVISAKRATCGIQQLTISEECRVARNTYEKHPS